MELIKPILDKLLKKIELWSRYLDEYVTYTFMSTLINLFITIKTACLDFSFTYVNLSLIFHNTIATPKP